MDVTTHFLTGNIIYIASKNLFFPNQDSKFYRRFYSICLIGSMLPDIDIIFRIFGNLFYLQHHRGITHSIFFNMLIVSLFYLYYKKNDLIHSGKLTFIFASSLALHLFLDVCNSYGTMLLSPFSTKKYYLDLLYIIDFTITFIFFIPCVHCLFFRKKRAYSGFLARLSLSLLFVYIAYSAYLKISLKKEINFIVENTGVSLVNIIPDFLLATNKKIIMEDSSHYYISNYTDKKLISSQFPKFSKEKLSSQYSMFDKALNSRLAEFALAFSRFPVYSIKTDKKSIQVSIYDLRYYVNFFHSGEIEIDIFGLRPITQISKNIPFGFYLYYDKETAAVTYSFRNIADKL